MPDDRPQAVVVVAPVELDVASAPQFVRDLDAAFATGAHLVVADFGGTTFCDSSGLKVLVQTAEKAIARKQRFEVRHPSRMLLRMAAILGAASLLGLPIDDRGGSSERSRGQPSSSSIAGEHARTLPGAPRARGAVASDPK